MTTFITGAIFCTVFNLPLVESAGSKSIHITEPSLCLDISCCHFKTSFLNTDTFFPSESIHGLPGSMPPLGLWGISMLGPLISWSSSTEKARCAGNAHSHEATVSSASVIGGSYVNNVT